MVSPRKWSQLFCDIVERICEDLTVDHSTNAIISGRIYLDTEQIVCEMGFETPTKEPSFSVQCNHDKSWNSTFCYRKFHSISCLRQSYNYTTEIAYCKANGQWNKTIRCESKKVNSLFDYLNTAIVHVQKLWTLFTSVCILWILSKQTDYYLWALFFSCWMFQHNREQL